MSNLYRVINNEHIEQYLVKVGDVCELHEYDSEATAWFHNEDWLDDGVWCLMLTKVEEILEEK